MDSVQRKRAGIASLVVAGIFAALTATAALSTEFRRESVASDLAAKDQKCEADLKLLGATTVARSEAKITAQWNSLDGGYTQLGATSAGAMACPGWKMTGYCMGQECGTPGAMLELSRIKND